MAALEDIARAALNRQDFLARELVQEFERSGERIATAGEPATGDLRVRTMAAALVVLFASRRHLKPPAWTGNVRPFPEGFYTSKYAVPGSRTRANLEHATPGALQAFRVFASPDYLAQI